jgi:hypothetical protein
VRKWDVNFVEQSVNWYSGLQNYILRNPHFAPLHAILPATPEDLHNYQKSREIHYHSQMRAFQNAPLRDLMIRAIDEYVRTDLKMPSFPKLGDPKVVEAIQSIDQKGYAYLSAMPADKVQAMKSYFENQLVENKDKKLVSVEEASLTENIANYPTTTILRCPHLLEMANDPEILSIVEGYLGTIPTVIVMATWWSFGGRENAKDAQLFHYDYDDYRFCKLFLYLTDVDENSGPHCFVEGTHRAEEVHRARHRWAHDSQGFFNFYNNSLRKSDEDVRKYFGKEFTYLTGNAGSRFIVDTIGLHKGELPKNQNRLLCQITFGVSPSLQEAPTMLQLDPASREYHAIQQLPAAKYVHRFFVNPDGNTKPAEENSPEVTISQTKKDPTLVMDAWDSFNSDTVDFFLRSIFKDESFLETIRNKFATQKIVVKSFNELMTVLRTLFQQSISWMQLDPNHQLIAALSDLSKFEQNMHRSLSAYDMRTKSNPYAVYWPNPERAPDTSLFTTLPMAKRYPIVSKDTPIGSAGSCFAFEIAYYLQEKGFNYVVTEKGHRVNDGVVLEGFDPANPYEKFSANYGILFNTPSFRQLAEKAFNKKKLPKICIKKTRPGRESDVIYTDPFRENVFFLTPESFEADYDLHIEATRNALLKSKVFILTLGLNECWEFLADGSVVSRNPHSDMFYRLLRHRTLTVEENVSNVQAFLDIVREHNPDFQLIISVSPIPFLATGRADEHHVVTANAHSKAVLRVAAEEIVRRNKGVYYLPSFEMVTSCIPNPWEIDQRHVTRAAVHRVMELFNAMFVQA